MHHCELVRGCAEEDLRFGFGDGLFWQDWWRLLGRGTEREMTARPAIAFMMILGSIGLRYETTCLSRASMLLKCRRLERVDSHAVPIFQTLQHDQQTKHALTPSNHRSPLRNIPYPHLTTSTPSPTHTPLHLDVSPIDPLVCAAEIVSGAVVPPALGPGFIASPLPCPAWILFWTQDLPAS